MLFIHGGKIMRLKSLTCLIVSLILIVLGVFLFSSVAMIPEQLIGTACIVKGAPFGLP